MKILTKEVLAAFAKQGDTSSMKTEDIRIVLKLFNPCGAGTWYLYDREDEDVYWCFANLGDSECAECGTVSLSELTGMRFPPLGLPIERDMYFEPLKHSLAEVIKIVKNGGHI